MATSRLEEVMDDLTRFQDEWVSSMAEVKISHAQIATFHAQNGINPLSQEKMTSLEEAMADLARSRVEFME